MKLGKMMLTSLLVLGVAPAQAAPPAAAPPKDMAAEVARLEAEVREQRALIMQLVRVEQEHYDLLLRLIQGRASAADVPSHEAEAPPAASPPVETPEKRAPRTAAVRGKVAFPGGTLKDVYVYVENVKAAPVHGRTFEIGQRDKQFVPQVAVVQRGTTVSFPNYDSVFHNVFSPSVRHPFDLGSYRAGDPVRSVEMTTTGVIDVFCNVHSRMHASVLVVPSALYTRVAGDGSFELPGVPVGARKIVVWGPRSKPVDKTVDAGSAGDVTFTLEAAPEVPHNNKVGQPYGAYKD